MIDSLCHIRGYATTFDVLSEPLGHDKPFRAIVRPRAYGGLVNVIPCTVLHGGVQIATTWNRSLRLWTDSHGVAVEFDVPATPEGAGLRAMVAGSGGINSMSIGLTIRESVVSYDEDGLPIHDVSRAEIDHVSIVEAGAFEGACCWVAGADRMPREVRAASIHWHFGRIARDRKRGADRALARYLVAKSATAATRGPADYRKPKILIHGLEPLEFLRRSGASYEWQIPEGF
jgi:phage head maturation protease